MNRKGKSTFSVSNSFSSKEHRFVHRNFRNVTCLVEYLAKYCVLIIYSTTWNLRDIQCDRNSFLIAGSFGLLFLLHKLNMELTRYCCVGLLLLLRLVSVSGIVLIVYFYLDHLRRDRLPNLRMTIIFLSTL